MITSAGIEIDDIGGSLTWGAFGSFIRKTSQDSALFRELHPEIADWGSRLRTNIILADIFDVLAQINANMCGGFSHKKAPKTKPYPRPWGKDATKKIGKAVPKNELHEWFKNKWKERSDG